MMSEVLGKWEITKHFMNNYYYVNGTVIEGENHLNGEYISFKTILDIVDEGEAFKVTVADGTYLLRKADAADSKTDVNEIIKEIKAQKEKIKLTAEKLLSAGDCLICNEILYYHSNDGIEILYPDVNVYTFPKENFIIEHYCENFFVLQKCSAKNKNGRLYELNLEMKFLKRYDYKSI